MGSAEHGGGQHLAKLVHTHPGMFMTPSLELKIETLKPIYHNVKLLGAIISDDLKWDKNTEYLG